MATGTEQRVPGGALVIRVEHPALRAPLVALLTGEWPQVFVFEPKLGINGVGMDRAAAEHDLVVALRQWLVVLERAGSTGPRHEFERGYIREVLVQDWEISHPLSQNPTST